MASERLYGDPADWERAVAHVDMDAFYVAVELLGWQPEVELSDGLEKTIEHARTWAGLEKRAPAGVSEPS